MSMRTGGAGEPRVTTSLTPAPGTTTRPSAADNVKGTSTGSVSSGQIHVINSNAPNIVVAMNQANQTRLNAQIEFRATQLFDQAMGTGISGFFNRICAAIFGFTISNESKIRSTLNDLSSAMTRLAEAYDSDSPGRQNDITTELNHIRLLRDEILTYDPNSSDIDPALQRKYDQIDGITRQAVNVDSNSPAFAEDVIGEWNSRLEDAEDQQPSLQAQRYVQQNPARRPTEAPPAPLMPRSPHLEEPPPPEL